jgi:tetrahydromethanopterin S-methyltransferase subunit F
MKTILKIPLKIIAIPFIPVLFLLSLMLTFLGWASGKVFALVSLLFSVLSIITLFQGEMSTGIAGLVIAFLISPFGIPAIAVWLADVLDDFKYSLKCFITG